MTSTLATIRQIRLEKVKKLRELGLNPYPESVERTHQNIQLVEDFDKNKGKEVKVVGRLMSWRDHGAIKFGHIQDFTGKIQLILRRNTVIPTNKTRQNIGWNNLDLLDVGDHIQAKGILTKSNTGEISIETSEIKMVAKSLRPLPEKWKGIEDVELKLRRRYLDFTINPQERERFIRKSIFWKKAREFMVKRGFIEVETPILELVTGGADARPFITHHNALNQDFYLRISSELFQKRLIGGGFEKIFVLGPNFRNEGIDDEHLQEFYQLEYYWAYSNINDTIELTKELYKYLAKEVYGRTRFTYKGYTFDLADEWKTIDYTNVIKEKLNVDIINDPLEKLHQVLREKGVEIEFEKNRNRFADNLWKLIRKDIAGPAALINIPKFISPLAKSKENNPEVTTRFQPIIAGTEVGNAYSELNDPIEQYERFKEQQAMRDQGDEEAQMMDIDFIEMLEYGMPPCSSIGFSERLFWILEGVTAREGTLFPQTKYYLEDTTKEIYGIKESKTMTSMSINKFNNIVKELREKVSALDMKKIDGQNVISIDKNLLKKYENINIGVAIIKDVSVNGIENKLKVFKVFKKNVVETIRSNLKEEMIDDIPQIESYSEMYRKMGVDNQSRKSSVETILRRVVTGKGLYNINTCIDACHLTSLLTQITVSVFDLDKIEFPIVLREVKDEEDVKIIDGEVKRLKVGEVCYFDQKGPYAIDYNFTGAERTKITKKTKNLWVTVEGVNDISSNQVADALNLAIELITKFCGGKVELKGIKNGNGSPSH